MKQKRYRVAVQGYFHTELPIAELQELGFITQGGLYYYAICQYAIQASVQAEIRFNLVVDVDWRDNITFTPREV